MAEQRSERITNLVVRSDEPVIAVPLDENGEEMERYSVAQEPAAGATLPETVRDALSLAGAWSDLDWEQTVEDLDRIRHESKPTPLIEEL